MLKTRLYNRIRRAVGDRLEAWPRQLRRRVRGTGERSVEALHHFRCPRCSKWFAIGDAPWNRDKWYCPWCGIEGHYNPMENGR